MSRNFLQQTNAGDSMANPISGPIFSHSGTPLLSGSPLGRSQSLPDISKLKIARGDQLPSRPIHAMSLENMDLSDTEARGQITNLLNEMCDRLNLMPQMGKLKVILGVGSLDPSQEDRVLRVAIGKANKLNIPEKVARGFVQSQMNIAKSIQEEKMATENKAREASSALPPSEEEKTQATTERDKLREKIGAKLDPVLESLQPLVEHLANPAVQKEIVRQLNHSVLTGECAKSEIKLKIRQSFEQFAIQPRLH